MVQTQPIKIGQTEENTKSFVYETSSRLLCRFFQLNLDDGFGSPEDPLAGRLLTCHFIESLESVKYWFSSWKNFAEFARSDQNLIMKELSGVSTFSALSYSWGQDRERYPLYVSTISSYHDNDPTKFAGYNTVMDHEPERNGYLWITSSLHSFLQEMRQQRSKTFFWIDAICINQEDNEDKNDQLPRMKDIYEWAENVYVWLGAGTLIEHEMMRIMPSITSRLIQSQRADGRDLRDWLANLELPGPDQYIWKACAGLFMRDWWSRLWTLQEVVAHSPNLMSDGIKSIFILCGPVQVPWTVFTEFADALAKNQLKQWLITGSESVRPDHCHGLDAIVEVRTCRQSLKQNKWSVALGSLLVATRRRQATVSADMVIGMQALLDHATIRKLALNVSMPTEEVFIRFGKHYIRNEVKECLLNHTATQSRLPGLPSWCPDFASPEETISIGTRWLGHSHEKATHRAQMPCAGFQKKGPWRLPRNRFYYARMIKNNLVGRGRTHEQYDTHNPRQIAVVPDTDRILASGIDLDRIAHVIPPNRGAEAADFLSFNATRQTLEWDQRCFGLAKRTLRGVPSSRAAYDLYARTLVANRVALLPHEPLDPDSAPAPSEITESVVSDDDGEDRDPLEPEEPDRVDASELFIDRHETRDFAGPYLSFRDYLRWTEEAGESLREEILAPDARAFARCLAAMSRRRCFFATAKGRIGMGPADARVGDRLAVIFYCPTPYLLRLVRKDDEGEAWKFVGEAYARGLMYGEALEMFEYREVEERKWVIE